MFLRPAFITFGLALTLSVSAPALGNGRFPSAQHVVVGPGRDGRTVVLRTTFGLLVSRDLGASWAWICEDSMFYPYVLGATEQIDVPVELTAEGRVVFGWNQGARSFTDGCSMAVHGSATGRNMVDLTSTPAGDVIYAVNYSRVGASQVFRASSTDMVFIAQDTGMSNVEYLTVEVAPSNPRRLYFTARELPSRTPRLFRSDDAGATLRPVGMSADLGDEAFVSGVDPTQPDTLWVRINTGLGSALLRSRDGGGTFTRVLRTRDPMLGFALSDDGRTVWAGSINEGVHRSTDGGDTFAQVNPMPALCLRQHAGTLWLCTDWIQQPFALGRSTDGGRTFTASLRFEDLRGPPMCTNPSEGASICEDRWDDLRRELLNPDADAGVVVPPLDAGPRDAGNDTGAARDAGMDAPPADARADGGGSGGGGGDGDCDCSVARGRAPSRGALIAALGLVAGLFRRRNRIASATPRD